MANNRNKIDNSIDAAVNRIMDDLRHDNGAAAFQDLFKEMVDLQKSGLGQDKVAALEGNFLQKVAAQNEELKKLGYPIIDLTENGQQIEAKVQHKDGRVDSGHIDGTAYGQLYGAPGRHKIEPTAVPPPENSNQADISTLAGAAGKIQPDRRQKPGGPLVGRVEQDKLSAGSEYAGPRDSNEQFYLGGQMTVPVGDQQVLITCKGVPYNAPEGYRVRAELPAGTSGALREASGTIRTHADGQRYYDIDQVVIDGRIQAAPRGKYYWSMPLMKQNADGAATY